MAQRGPEKEKEQLMESTFGDLHWHQFQSVQPVSAPILLPGA